jgi:hypothetical protein
MMFTEKRKKKMSTGDKDVPCPACRAGFQNECWYAWESEEWESCGEITFNLSGEVKTTSTDGGSDSSETREQVDTGYIQDGYNGYKDITEYKDPVSTGRKRAAEMYPINPGMVCEWAGLKFAGGGVVPIVGCIGRAATDRHHGPDKNTMNNAEGNVHRICAFCHNAWHGVNDPFYGERPDPTKPFIPAEGDVKEHDPLTKATTEEVLQAERERVEAATKL